MRIPNDKNFKSTLLDVLAGLLGLSKEEFQVEKYRMGTRHRGAEAHLIVRAIQQTFVVEVRKSGEAAQIASAIETLSTDKTCSKRSIPVVAVPYMGDVGRRLCEAAGISWVDLSGNALLNAPGLIVNVLGRPNRYKRRGRPSNVFAPKSSRIARQLLMDPSRVYTQSELAECTGLSPSLTSKVIHRLHEIFLIERAKDGTVRVHDPHRLIDAWRERADFTKHDVIKGQVFARDGLERFRKVATVLSSAGLSFAATALGPAWLLTHYAMFNTCTFYVTSLPSEEILGQLGFEPNQSFGNVWLTIPNDEGVFHGVSEVEGIPCTHPVQVYLDLKDHPERASEAATELRHRLLDWDSVGR